MADDFTVRFELDVAAATQNANRLAQSLGGTAKATQQVQQSTRSLGTSLPTLRYALYDVSSTATMAGAALGGLGVAAAYVGVEWEKAFAAVQRTTETTGSAATQLREDLVALTREVPLAFTDIAEIATLGGQLGIPSEGIEDFSRVVAMMAATTNLSIDSAATALGRFRAILGVSTDDFERLASSILLTGINSVATETEIVAISTQISSMGAFAGLTADQVVGLSSALASVGARPELSRGTLTRTFTLMSQAVSGGGEALQEFSRVSGVSAEEFRRAWGTADFSDVFLGFLRGISEEGDRSVQTLRDLGITSVRDVPLLQRLALAIDQTEQALADASQGWESGSTLVQQYSIQAETTAARLQILVNAVQELADSLFSANSGPVKDAIEGLIALIRGITDFVSSPFGGEVTDWAVRTGALAAGLLLLAGMLANLGANAAAVATFMGAAATATTGFATAAGAATVAGGGLIRTMTVMTRLLGAAGLVGLAAVARDGLRSLGDGLVQSARDAQGWGDGLDGALKILEDLSPAFERTGDQARQIGNRLVGVELGSIFRDFIADPLSGATFGLFPTLERLGKVISEGGDWRYFSESGAMAADAIKEVTTAAKELAGDGDIAGSTDLLVQLGLTLGMTRAEAEETARAFLADEIGMNKAEIAARSFEVQSAGTARELSNLGLSGEEVAVILRERLATSLGMTVEELDNLESSIAKGLSGFGNMGDVLKSLQEANREWAESVAKETSSSKDSWEDYYDGVSVSVDQFITKLSEEVVAQAQFADNLAWLLANGYTAFAAEAARLGPDAAQIVAESIAAGPEALDQIEASFEQLAITGSDAFANKLIDNTSLLQAAQELGDDVFQQVVDAIAAGDEAEIQRILSEYDLVVDIDGNVKPAEESFTAFRDKVNATILNLQTYLDLSPAEASLRAFKLAHNESGITLRGYMYRLEGHATGGYITGPGTGTSDSIPAMLSNGEYVIRAAAVRKYGTGLFDALNRGVAKFASGGQVGSGVSFPSSMVTEFGPQSAAMIRGLGGGPNVVVMLDDMAIAQAANRGNAKLVGQGIR